MARLRVRLQRATSLPTHHNNSSNSPSLLARQATLPNLALPKAHPGSRTHTNISPPHHPSSMIKHPSRISMDTRRNRHPRNRDMHRLHLLAREVVRRPSSKDTYRTGQVARHQAHLEVVMKAFTDRH